MSNINLNCLLVEQMIKDTVYSVACWFNIFIILFILLLIFILFREYSKSKISLHCNLIILIANAVVYYLIYSIPTLLILLRYKVK
ncbi:unnamed protein product [Meloidogyne enterolobii]|uniref:Uncharacterized protein n=1 Tax=Meloidogyne enterolobii TaxID=390850 RepID=A0ACB0YB48_MELEN